MWIRFIFLQGFFLALESKCNIIRLLCQKPLAVGEIVVTPSFLHNTLSIVFKSTWNPFNFSISASAAGVKPLRPNRA